MVFSLGTLRLSSLTHSFSDEGTKESNIQWVAEGHLLISGGFGPQTSVFWLSSQVFSHCFSLHAEHTCDSLVCWWCWLFFFFFSGLPLWCMEVPRLGVESEPWRPAYATATSVTYTTAHGNNGTLTYWARTGIELASPWLLVGFVTTELQQKLPFLNILNHFEISGYVFIILLFSLSPIS